MFVGGGGDRCKRSWDAATNGRHTLTTPPVSSPDRTPGLSSFELSSEWDFGSGGGGGGGEGGVLVAIVDGLVAIVDGGVLVAIVDGGGGGGGELGWKRVVVAGRMATLWALPW